MSATTSPRLVMITIRVTADEREAITAAAKAAGESVNQWCRRVLLEAAGKAVH